MNQMQQMLMQAQKMQRELAKAHSELDQKEFSAKKAGIVEAVVKGDRTIVSIKIDSSALNGDNKEMIEDSLVMAINDALGQIKKANEDIDEKVTGQKGALPF